METFKTQNLYKKLVDIMGHKEKMIFVTSKEADKNFLLAQEALKNVKVVNPNNVNVLDLLLFDKIIFTVDSLREFSQLFLAVTFQKQRPKWVRDEFVDELLNVHHMEKDKDPAPIFDPKEGFEPNFEFLKEYYEEYQNQLVNENLEEQEFENSYK
jgi:hypothetical protein